MTGTVTDIDIVRVMMNEFYLELPGLSNFDLRAEHLANYNSGWKTTSELFEQPDWSFNPYLPK